MSRHLIPIVTAAPHDSAAGSAARPAGRLQRLGDALQQNASRIRFVQWTVVGIYLFLVTVPAFLPLPSDDAHVLGNLTLLAQFLFWGIWWPFVVLSIAALGRLWCGVFCPEGTLTEAVSRMGLGRAIPRWVRWQGWPCVAFVVTTVYGQLVSVYQYAQAALLVLGGSTAAAVAVGWMYGRGWRVWCRYLCPVNGVFNLLGRLAPLHFRVDRSVWDAAAHPSTTRLPQCPPLLDVRRMQGAGACHMCGRCSGHRDAVTLVRRSPVDEIARLGQFAAKPWDTALLLFGLIGVAMRAFHWTISPWYADLRAMALDVVTGRGWTFLVSDKVPWWLLTHYPKNQDIFTWLDGVLISTYILGTGFVMAGLLYALCWLAARALGRGSSPHHLALCWVPLGGCGVFLGLSMTTLSMLRHEGWHPAGIPELRATALAASTLWSLWLAWQATQGATHRCARRVLAMLPVTLGCAWIVSGWALLFFVW